MTETTHPDYPTDARSASYDLDRDAPRTYAQDGSLKLWGFTRAGSAYIHAHFALCDEDGALLGDFRLRFTRRSRLDTYLCHLDGDAPGYRNGTGVFSEYEPSVGILLAAAELLGAVTGEDTAAVIR